MPAESGGLGDTEDERRVRLRQQSGRCELGGEVGQQPGTLICLCRKAVEDEKDRDAPVPGRLEELEGGGVGVASDRCHEDAEIGEHERLCGRCHSLVASQLQWRCVDKGEVLGERILTDDHVGGGADLLSHARDELGPVARRMVAVSP